MSVQIVRDILFYFLANPCVLLRDILLYPTPLDPYNTSGHLRRQTTIGGPIQATGICESYLMIFIICLSVDVSPPVNTNTLELMQQMERNRYTPPDEPSTSVLSKRFCSTPVPIQKRARNVTENTTDPKRLRKHLPFSS